MDVRAESQLELRSTLTCPACAHQAAETMPTDACLFFYDCKGCGARLKPKPGDCCVFCSYGSVPCPPVQAARSGNSDASCCAGKLGMTSTADNAARDWLGNTRTNILAWGLPHATLVLGLLADAPTRTGIWIVALAWMGTACILNARRCGRTHCRFTGPYYLAMIIPTLALGLSVVSADLYASIVLGVIIVLGGRIMWYATERAWGTFS